MPASARQCSECSSPLARDQHYCLVCGARAAEREPEAAPRWRQTPARTGPRAGRSQRPLRRARRSRAAPAPAHSGLRLPSARVSALLVAAFLGFGVVHRVCRRDAVTGRPRRRRAGTPAARAPTRSPRRPRRRGLGVDPGAARSPGDRTRSDTRARADTPAPATTSTSANSGASTGESGGRPKKDPAPDPDRAQDPGRARASDRRQRRDQEASADQARVRDHALRRAICDDVRAGLDGPLPLADAREEGGAPGPLRRGRPRGARKRGGDAERPGADRGNRRQLPQLRGNRARRAGQPTNRCWATAASIPPPRRRSPASSPPSTWPRGPT